MVQTDAPLTPPPGTSMLVNSTGGAASCPQFWAPGCASLEADAGSLETVLASSSQGPDSCPDSQDPRGVSVPPVPPTLVRVGTGSTETGSASELQEPPDVSTPLDAPSATDVLAPLETSRALKVGMVSSQSATSGPELEASGESAITSTTGTLGKVLASSSQSDDSGPEQEVPNAMVPWDPAALMRGSLFTSFDTGLSESADASPLATPSAAKVGMDASQGASSRPAWQWTISEVTSARSAAGSLEMVLVRSSQVVGA
mmetsp:Transcript_48114/g.103143  ORF Transcript_48114/g.103143 Transcript_48114/m.103143 type:complete len:258 (-) Transcript_48114:720-1493(-)